MSAQHTPGPWKADWYKRSWRLCNARGVWLATAHHAPESDFEPGDVSVDQARANARLIAAAPELLEALRACATVLASHGLATEAVARAAIAKATGGAA